MTRTLPLLAAAGLLAGLAAGCSPRKEYSLQLTQARESLVRQFPQQAEQHLDQAQTVAVKHSLKPTAEAALLRAEARLQQDDLVTARQLANRVADEFVPGTRQRGLAEEMLAKIAIRRGEFLAAEAHLLQAERSYEDPADRQRAGDLVHLVRGLIAFGRGQNLQAQRHWQSIMDPQLRQSISRRVAAR